jgi:DNA repair exonuclease SbcCD ATPase subunit
MVQFFIINPKLENFRIEVRNKEIQRVKSIFFKDFKSFKNNLSSYSMNSDLYRAVLDKDLNYIKNYFSTIYLDTSHTDYIGYREKFKTLF